jgi:xanthine dehydrogenase accessory factor
MKNALAIMRFLQHAIEHERECVLVTSTKVLGSSARSIGTHMAVHENGSFAGSFSGGCVEAAVIGEALSVLEGRECRQVRFGTGSPYIDIRLPCGGGIDLLFTPNPPLSPLHQTIERLEARRRASLELGRDGSLAIGKAGPDGWRDGIFHITHQPDLRLLVLGNGPETVALARLASGFTPDLKILTSDRQVLQAVTALGVNAEFLLSPTARVDLSADADAAFVFLFHDHDWETDLLRRVLSSNAFYIGAMGSRATHARRIEALLELGCTPASVARIVGPAGLIPATRDPDTLAISVLSQVVSEHQRSRERSHSPRAQAEPLDIGWWETGLCGVQAVSGRALRPAL